jgi:DNA polymerase-3 subunit gamma/tau
MSNLTYYLKYRPQTLNELDSAEVRETLEKIVSSKRLPHAFLFAGPKGTGKTSAARILAKIVNCERKNAPCNKCEECLTITRGNNLDVIELDAASHRGIDDIRALKDAVKLAPARARKKVYIIDEAHMLTLEASNALLKTLEEPPSHVLFILATTNPEKLIETIRSRVTLVNFKKANEEEIARSLGRIVKGEKIKIDKEGLSVIAQVAKGSFRDAVKLLEQLVSEKISLKPEEIKNHLLKSSEFDVEKFFELLALRKTKEAVDEVIASSKKGVTMENLAESVLAKLRNELLVKVGIGEGTPSLLEKEEILSLIALFSEGARELKSALIEELPIEVAVIKWGEGGKEKEDLNEETKNEKIETKEEEKVDLEEPKQDQEASSSEPTSENPILASNLDDVVWKDILTKVRPINASIEALLRAARPMNFDGKNLNLGVYYRFHKERLEENGNRRILEDVVTEIIGVPVRIFCTLTEPPIKKEEEKPPEKTVLTEGEDKDIIKVAEEIFSH